MRRIKLGLKSWNWDLIIKLFGVILIPIALCIITHRVTENLEKRKDIDLLFKYSSRIEESYRYVRNHFEELESGITDYHPSVFREKLSSLDHNMISFYFKAMMVYTADKSRHKKAVAFFDTLYWGKKDIDGKYSFREFLIKNEKLAREDRGRFLSSIKDAKETLQYFDDLMHLAIFTTALSLHGQGDEVNKRFEEVGDDVDYFEKSVYDNERQLIDKIKFFIDNCQRIQSSSND